MAAQDTTDTRARFGFFLEHAGYATPPGRAACALGLARAEAAFEAARDDGRACILWEHDDDPDLSWADAETLARLEAGSLVCLSARVEVRQGERWEVAASLCGIVVESERDPYCRVVAAELAAEAGFGEDAPERASEPEPEPLPEPLPADPVGSILAAARGELTERWSDYREDFGAAPSVQYAADVIHEIADGSVPVYTSQLLKLACADNGLATEEPELGPAFDGSPTPTNIIAANLYERITADLFERFEEIRREGAEES